MTQWFSYLKHLDIPAKYKISHAVVEKLVASDIAFVEDQDHLKYDDILDHGKLSSKQAKLEETLKNLVTRESAFQIAQLEYEKKEARFVELTGYTTVILDQLYAQKKLGLKDIDDNLLLTAITDRDYEEINNALHHMTIIISRDVDVFRKRTNHLLVIWKALSQELMELIKSFEYRGLKVVSTNLRVKLIPELEEFKSALKDYNLGEESLSRHKIDLRLKEMVNQAREDLYGELTDPQIQLLEEINPDLKKDELIRILTDEKTRKDLIVLLETDKIELKMKKVIDRLI